MIACDPKYLHTPSAPDRSKWPYDTPIIVTELKRRGYTIANVVSLDSFEVFDATGQRWLHRALSCEAQSRDMVKANEYFLKLFYELKAELSALKQERM